ncbi:hypothetical protein MA03_05580 [Infirmifilum uzonense]|jgi:hypothetical protein|uniref:Uncharacterized protein n=1 Tax=Infirmifilum uzonense TaxID=1550241 RepID=A0A0F7FIU2_9CREN|nr:hypothetical protein MA03_05580 [Infirmifilum uzonense]
MGGKARNIKSTASAARIYDHATTSDPGFESVADNLIKTAYGTMATGGKSFVKWLGISIYIFMLR